MVKSAPVMLAARLLARNSTRSATSAGWVNRPVTIWLAACLATSSRVGAGRGADRVRDPVCPQPQVGGDGAGADGVDPDPVRPDFLGQRLAEAGQPGLGGAVVQHRRVGQPRVDRADRDDRSRSCREHGGQHGPAGPDGGHQVEVDGGEPVLVGDAQEPAGPGRGAADVVDQDVHAAARGGDERGRAGRRRPGPPRWRAPARPWPARRARRRTSWRQRTRVTPLPARARTTASPMPLLPPVTTAVCPASPRSMATSLSVEASSHRTLAAREP